MSFLSQSDIRHLLLSPLGKRISQDIIEKWSASFWNRTKSAPHSDGPSFTMMLPPPNVTGNLHLGHALTAAIEDALIRHRTMTGMKSKWIPGFDHAGLATQSIVERVLSHQEGKSRLEMGKDDFIKFANEWKDRKRDEMRNQLNRLGLDLRYEYEFFTTDKKSSQAVQAAFIKLFQKGLIYRDDKLVNWSRQLGTTLSDIEVTHVDGVKRYVRTNEELESRRLPQWFIRGGELAERAIEVVEDGSISMIPENYRRSWSSWLQKERFQDWCISRQSWWGHEIPAYKLDSSKDEPGNWIVANDLNEAKTILQSNDVIQDKDVLDTWFSSSLLPLTISGWPNRDLFAEKQTNGEFPLSIMETGFDILTYWVSKMVMMSIALEDKIPFRLILLHGMICDGEGKKMSKSKGNVIDPTDLIEGASLKDLQSRTIDSGKKGLIDGTQVDAALENQTRLFPQGIVACGADGLRAYLLSMDFQEEIVRVQIPQIEKVRRLMNKIWNVTRFAINLSETSEHLNENLTNDLGDIHKSHMDEPDMNILTELSKCISVAEINFGQDYQLHKLFHTLERFWVVHLSSDYIAHVRSSLCDDKIDPKKRALKVRILISCIGNSLKILHPFMPHMTEFLHQKLQVTHGNADVSDLEAMKPLRYEPYPRRKDCRIREDQMNKDD